jgi:hypothetical protein
MLIAIERHGLCWVFGLLIAILVLPQKKIQAQQNPASGPDRLVTCLPLLATDVCDGPIDSKSIVVDTLDPTGSWDRYLKLWQQLANDPSSPSIRRFLALPLGESSPYRIARGRTAPVGVPWKPGQFRRLSTPLLTIDSSANDDQTRAVADDLHRCYWLWTQVFFPFWKNASIVDAATIRENDSDAVTIVPGRRLTMPALMRVVLFADRQEYVRVLSAKVPGIEASTGYYDNTTRTSFFYVGEGPDIARSRRHEWTHQLFREATPTKLKQELPGTESDFWIVEGIAGYMESIEIDGGNAVTGGWDASRLQYARYRHLIAGDSISINELRTEGHKAIQKRPDLARWYSHAIAWTHALMHADHGSHRETLFRWIADVYRVNLNDRFAPPVTDSHPSLSIERFLKVDDAFLVEHPTTRTLTDLCLAGCDVSQTGLQSLPSNQPLQWLDLTGLPVDSASVESMVGDPAKLERLSLEGTDVDQTLGRLISQASSLTDLDLTSTSVDSSTFEKIPASLEVLYLTNTKVDDKIIDQLGTLPNLQILDVQRSRITDEGLKRLKTLCPQLDLNPLEIRE